METAFTLFQTPVLTYFTLALASLELSMSQLTGIKWHNTNPGERYLPFSAAKRL